MKIVCDSCGARYNIADEKVAGKVFRIRCKRCGAAIVVRGDEMEASAPAADAGADAAAAAAVWHVVVDGDQQGPLTPEQLQQMQAEGRLQLDDYVWREGYDGWKALRDASELQGLLGDKGSDSHNVFASAAGSAQPASSARADDTGQQGPVASRATHDGGADLFATSRAQSSTFSAMDPSRGTQPEPAAAQAMPAGGGLTGQRNENSVLFSLSNLQALATGNEASPAVPVSSASTGSAPAAASTTEGSGLIDIRALASAAGQSGPKQDEQANLDELLSLGSSSQLGGLSSPLLAPAPVEESKSKAPMWIAIGVAALVAVGAVSALVAVLIMKGDESAEPGAVDPTPGVASPDGVQPATTTGDPATPSAPQAGETTAGTTREDSTGEAEPEAADATRQTQGKTRRGGRHSDAKPASSSAKPSTSSSKPPAAKKPSGGNRDINSLLESALGNGGRKKPKPSAANANLPDVPSRSAVLSALRGVQGKVRSCGQGKSGVANTAITVTGATGRVKSARVSGQFAGTPVAACVARAVRGAKFPRFKRPTFSVNFPFAI